MYIEKLISAVCQLIDNDNNLNVAALALLTVKGAV